MRSRQPFILERFGEGKISMASSIPRSLMNIILIRDGIEDPFDLGPILHKYLSNEETNANGVNCPSERYKMIIRQALEALELLFQQTLLLSRLESSESDDTNLGRCSKVLEELKLTLHTVLRHSALLSRTLPYPYLGNLG